MKEFWADIRETEKKVQSYGKRRLDELRGAETLIQRVIQLQNQPGFREFVEAVSNLRQKAVDSLLRLTDDEKGLWRIQGEVKAYDNILSVMKNAESALGNLAELIEAAENRLGSDATPSEPIWRMT